MNLSITQKLSILLLIPAAGALIALVIVYAYLTEAANDGAMINLAGSQRMLSKQLYIYADMVNKGQGEERVRLRETIGSFDQTLQLLEKGGQVMGQSLPAVPTEAADELARVRVTWLDLKNAAALVASRPVDDPQARQAFDFIAANAQQLTEDSNRLVSAIEIVLHTLKRRMLYTLLAVAGFDVLMLFAGVMLIRRYIAKRKQAEDELQWTASDLQRKAAELERSNSELEQFAYVASHDLKAPLRAIANLSRWIEEDLSDQMSGATRKQMIMLRGRVDRMEALINGLLQYARTGRMDAAKEAVDVKLLIDEVIESLAPPAEFTIEIDPDMPVLQTARVPLYHVFSNLIDNAIKHHDRCDGHLHIAVQDMEDFYEFSVIDDGAGIAPEFHAKVFQIFQTLQARDDVESTGVGLSLAKKIVEEQGGEIHLQSAQGEGAKFRFSWAKKTAAVQWINRETRKEIYRHSAHSNQRKETA